VNARITATGKTALKLAEERGYTVIMELLKSRTPRRASL
jgi:hypothetical protein